MWANAVTIKDNTKRGIYKNAAIGTPVAIEDINTFMVWIPRYSYTLGNTYGYQIEGAETPSETTPGAFDIKFVDQNIIDMGSGKYTGDTPDNYFTPSSFCWGDTCDDEATRKDPENIELSGIWVAKFEITGTTNDISSIPSVTSINGKVSDLFTSIQNGINGENGLTFYGLSGNYDTHMIKNTEWGAMTILSQSRYGKYGNSKYNGIEKKVVYNNCIDGITGIGADTVSASSETCKTNTYETQKGQAASTTGNIYGLYDTSGGREDHVMGNYEHYSGRKDSYNSGFSGLNADGSTTTGVAFPSRRYYNLYKDKGYIKGDAILYFYTGSMTPPSFSNPWAARGGNAYRTSVLSPFEIVSAAGFSGSTRFVLIPTK